MTLTSRRRAGFNLIQLIVILAIIAILLALLLPAVQRVREAATRTESINDMKQICLALHNTNDVYRRMPPAYSAFGNIQFPASLHVHILPFIEQEPLFRQYTTQKGGGNTKDASINVYISKQDYTHHEKTAGIQNYAANLRVFSDQGVNTAHDKPMPALGDEVKGSAGIPRTFVDGTSNTIVFVTKLAVCGDDGGSRYAAQVNTKYAAFFGQNPAKVAASPNDATATFQLAPDAKQCLNSPLMGQSFDKRGLITGLGDASVRTLTPRLTPQTWNYAVQPNDQNILGADWE
jgi:hypothetical protein